jgi:hypothetical protein
MNLHSPGLICYLFVWELIFEDFYYVFKKFIACPFFFDMFPSFNQTLTNSTFSRVVLPLQTLLQKLLVQDVPRLLDKHSLVFPCGNWDLKVDILEFLTLSSQVYMILLNLCFYSSKKKSICFSIHQINKSICFFILDLISTYLK